MSAPAKATASVPASSANLGPGFDAFGLALDVRDRFEAEAADEWSIEVVGEGEDTLARDEGNLVVVAAKRAFEAAGVKSAARIRCENRIPVGRGLGSSAAAIVGGLLLADALSGAGMSRRELLRLAAGIEGHADNVAAALLGGFVIVRREADGIETERFEPDGGVAVVAALSHRELATADARRALPETVPHADAAANAGRAALFALGIAGCRRDLVRAGASDFLHERYRAELIPDAEDTRQALLEAGADAAVLSGAGPTMLGIFVGVSDLEALERAHDASARLRLPVGRKALVVGVDRRGAYLDVTS